MASLEQLTGIFSILTLLSSAAHLRIARLYRGNRRGSTISFRNTLFIYLSAFAVLASSIALLTLYFQRLLSNASIAGTKGELIIVAFATSALVYSGILGCDRRRRTVAVKLASIPCFGNGNHAANHQLLAVEKSPMLCFAPQFIAPESPEPTISGSSSESRSAQSHKDSPEKRKSSTIGITKRKVWEISCRSASTWVYGRAKRQAWPLNVVRTYRTKGKRFVLIKDETVQDGAGAVLLDPLFIQSRHLDKQRIARVVFQALHRAAFCVLRSWNNKIEASLFQRFAQLPSVICMLTGDLRQDIQKDASAAVAEDERCYVTELLWAIVMVEVLDYLQFKRRDLPLLSWLTQLPQWLCQHDAGKIDREINTVFEAWKAGIHCGKSPSRPCDSECCCHSSFSQTGCGCQCPCVCACP